MVAAAACSTSEGTPTTEVVDVIEEVASDAVGDPNDDVPVDTTSESANDATEDLAGDVIASGSTDAPEGLPERVGPRRQTTGSVPHIQTDAELVPDVDAELRRRAFLLPGVEDRATVVSLPGARGLWLSDSLDLVRGDVLGGHREMAHIHTDGSLHVWMTIELAVEVDATKWGELHPWVDRDGFWNGVVMIYTPETMEEVDITIDLLVDAYNFITGAAIDPADLA